MIPMTHQDVLACPDCGRGEMIDGKCDRCDFVPPAPSRPLAKLKEAEQRIAGVAVAPAPSVDDLMALVYLYGAQVAEHPEDLKGSTERLRAIKACAGRIAGHRSDADDQQG